MVKVSLFCLGVLALVGVASVGGGAEELKPGQQKAKNKMMEDSSLLDNLKRASAACGVDLKITGDFSSYSMDEWASGTQVAGRAESLVVAVQRICEDKAYKPFLVKALNTIHVTFGGRGGPDILPNLSLENGVLTYKLNKENVNIQDKTEAFIRKQLDK